MLRILIILLTLAAAAVHFKFFIEDPSGGLIYLLNGIGWLAVGAALSTLSLFEKSTWASPVVVGDLRGNNNRELHRLWDPK